ncbi:dihydroxyacetone kinase subunit DhaL [Pectinatus haikarae]
MKAFDNKKGRPILLAMVRSIQQNKTHLSDIDGLIGDGDHGINMNKGFSLFEKEYKDKELSFNEGLEKLGTTLMNKIGGSMGPIYGTLFIGMGEAGSRLTKISLADLTAMIEKGYSKLSEIIEARPGDKTLIDTLAPALESLRKSTEKKEDFKTALIKMKAAAKAGSDSTRELKARYGRASRLGERSIGVPDAGSVSCRLLLTAMGDAIIGLLE